MKTFTRYIFIIAMLIVGTSCALFEEMHEPPNLVVSDNQAQTNQNDNISEFLSTYRLGTGDMLSIRVFGEPDLSTSSMRLTDTGTIFLPAIGEIKVGGMTMSQIENHVTDKLRGRILINPKVSVSVDQYRSFFINGMVKSPGAYPYQPNLTVRKAASLAGGLHERASLRKIFVIRADNKMQTPELVNFDNVIYPGDIVTIEESFF